MKLPKAQQAVIAAHEAGMHDRKPTPATCRECAREAAEMAAPAVSIVTGAPVKPRRVLRARQPIRPTHPKARPVDAPMPPDVEPTEGFGLIEPAPAFRSREEWMLSAVEHMRPWIAEVGAPVGPVRISFGWPGGRGSKKNVRGQCWMPEAVKDSVPAIFVSPAMEVEDVPTILGIILHEMNHAAGHPGHVGAFAKTAAALGFIKPWTSSEGKTEDLLQRLTDLAAVLGPLDHASINNGHGLQGTGPAAPPVQSTRMLKVYCPNDGYTLRATKRWLEAAVPECPLCGTEMTVDW